MSTDWLHLKAWFMPKSHQIWSWIKIFINHIERILNRLYINIFKPTLQIPCMWLRIPGLILIDMNIHLDSSFIAAFIKYLQIFINYYLNITMFLCKSYFFLWVNRYTKCSEYQKALSFSQSLHSMPGKTLQTVKSYTIYSWNDMCFSFSSILNTSDHKCCEGSQDILACHFSHNLI